jgi:hypothetical protein
MAREIEIEVNGDAIVKSGTCMITGDRYTVTVAKQDYLSWTGGTVAQAAMPTLDKEQREFMISGTTPEEWKRLFPAQEDE